MKKPKSSYLAAKKPSYQPCDAPVVSQNAPVVEQQMRSTEKMIVAEDSNDSGNRKDGSRECEGNEITIAQNACFDSKMASW